METPSPYTIIVQIVNFMILLMVLKYVLYMPLVEVMKKREESIRDKLDEADSINAEALNFKEQYERKLVDAQKEANALLANGSAEGERLKNELIAEGRRDAKHIQEKAMEELERERESAASQLKREVASLSVDLASRLLRDSMDAGTHGKLVSDLLRKAERNAV